MSRSLSKAITRRFVSVYDEKSISNRMRLRRFALLSQLFPALAEMTVLDVGGDARFWRQAPVKPAHVTLLNRYEQTVPEEWMSVMLGDGCDPPMELPEVDLAFSNSVIEHVGGHWRRLRFAELIRGAAKHYWVQTPNRYFPIEPHFLIPGLQFLPLKAMPNIVSRWKLGNYADCRERDDILPRVLDIELLTATHMEVYFPDGCLHCERFAGMTKSLIAVR